MAKATKPVAATKTAAKKTAAKNAGAKKPVAKPTAARSAATPIVDQKMKAGFKAGDDTNRPIFLYITGQGITRQAAVTINSVWFLPTVGVGQQYDVIGNPKPQDGYIAFRVKAKGVRLSRSAMSGPTSGQFSVSVTVGSQSLTCALEAILCEV